MYYGDTNSGRCEYRCTDDLEYGDRFTDFMCKTDCGANYKFDGVAYDEFLVSGGTPRRCVEDCYEVTTTNITIAVVAYTTYQYRATDPADSLKKCVFPVDCPDDYSVADPVSKNCVYSCPPGWYEYDYGAAKGKACV